MKLAWAGLLFLGTLFAGTQDSEFNVNTRYTVESVIISGDGWTANLASDQNTERISTSLRKQISALIGDKLNPSKIDELSGKLRKEFQARTVTHRVLRGETPQSVQVLFEIRLRPTRFDVLVPKFLYTSTQGFSGAVEASAAVGGHNGLALGLVSDADELVERYTGFTARYENTHLGSDRIHAGFEFASFHEQWNSATRNALAEAPASSGETIGLYRSRKDIAPEVTLVIAKPLTVSVGAAFQQMQESTPAGQTDAANALTADLHFHRRLDDSDSQTELDADYNVRAASRLLASDFVYVRHGWTFRYVLSHGRHVLSDRAAGGVLAGRAPLFERFVLGNSIYLRGWNRFEVNPLGGNRFAHNSVEYRYGPFEAFYDSGAVWDSGQPVMVRHSFGWGMHQGPVFLAVAFPARAGKAYPVFMVGMNY
jgi:Omp85 superfamily domain